MTGFEEPDHEFTTVEELLQAPQLVRFANASKFNRFARTKGPSDVYPTTIMAEMTDGSYWVAGYTTEEFLDLPKWERYDRFCQEA